MAESKRSSEDRSAVQNGRTSAESSWALIDRASEGSSNKLALRREERSLRGKEGSLSWEEGTLAELALRNWESGSQRKLRNVNVVVAVFVVVFVVCSGSLIFIFICVFSNNWGIHLRNSRMNSYSVLSGDERGS